MERVHDGTRDRVTVSFPATADFARIGRVAVAGLALRLGVDIGDVERLRLAVDQSVAALHGPGRIHLDAHWEPDRLSISVDNPDTVLTAEQRREVADALAAMVDRVEVNGTGISIELVG